MIANHVFYRDQVVPTITNGPFASWRQHSFEIYLHSNFFHCYSYRLVNEKQMYPVVKFNISLKLCKNSGKNLWKVVPNDENQIL